MSGETHPSSTARRGNVPTNAITRGVHADRGPFSAKSDVGCQQCGFKANTERDAQNIDKFAGETITSGNELSNGSFEDWTGGNPDSWTENSGSITQETTVGNFESSDDGTSSALFTRSGSDISVSQAVATPSDFNDDVVIFRARVKSVTNDVIRLRMDINGTSHFSSYNVAQQNFQELSISVNTPVTVSSLTVYILADDQNGTAYVDQSIIKRNGNPTTASVDSGCPHCGSFDFNTGLDFLGRNPKTQPETAN